MGFIGDWIVFAFKLFVAGVFGVILGWSREGKRMSEGSITLVFASATSAMLVDAVRDTSTTAQNSATPLVVAGILVGIGVLCIGIIMRGDEPKSASRSALLIWFSSAIGIMVGLSNFLPALTAVIFGYLLLQYIDDEEGDGNGKSK